MTMTDRATDKAAWDRISELEQSQAAVTSDIRGIYAGMDEIRDVLVRIQENAKPNMAGAIVILIAACTLVLGIGNQALAPIKENQNFLQQQLSENHAALIETARMEGWIEAKSEEYSKGIAYNAETALQSRERIARIEGFVDGVDFIREAP